MRNVTHLDNAMFIMQASIRKPAMIIMQKITKGYLRGHTQFYFLDNGLLYYDLVHPDERPRFEEELGSHGIPIYDGRVNLPDGSENIYIFLIDGTKGESALDKWLEMTETMTPSDTTIRFVHEKDCMIVSSIGKDICYFVAMRGDMVRQKEFISGLQGYRMEDFSPHNEWIGVLIEECK